MFIRFDTDNEKIIASRKKRLENEKIIYVAKTIFNKESKALEFETDKESFIKNANIFTNSTEANLNPIIAMRKIIQVKKGEKNSAYIVTSANDDKEQTIENLDAYMNIENLETLCHFSAA